MFKLKNNYYTKLSAAVGLVLVTSTASAISNYVVDENPMPGAKVTTSFKHQTNGITITSPYGFYESEFPSLNDLGHIAGMTDKENSDFYLIRGFSSGQAAVWRNNTKYNLRMDLIDNANPISITGCPDSSGNGVSENSECGSRVVAINNNGNAYGSSHGTGFGSYFPMGRSWSPDENGNYSLFAEHVLFKWASGKHSQVNDINEDGDIVGTGIPHSSAGPSDSKAHGLVQLSDGTGMYIGVGHQASRAFAINTNREVTGSALIQPFSNVARVFIWKDNGTDTGDLQFGGTLDGGNVSEGYDINDSGIVVGHALNGSDQLRAFKWNSNNIGGALEDLGHLGGNDSVARSINNAGVIVGRSKNSAGDNRGFIYIDGQMYDLNDYASGTAGYEIVDAYSINENGQILVRAFKGNGNVVEGNEYWLLTSQNLLTNPGFETGNISGWDGPGTVQSAVVYSGSHAIALAGDPSSWPGVHQTVSITGGNEYRFTSWLSVQGLTTGSYYFQVSWQDDNGNQVGAIDSFAWVTANGTFEKYESEFTAPSTATQVFFKVQANNADGIGYIDSVSIVDTAGDIAPEPGGNLLTNPGFETGDKSGWEGPGTVQSAIVHAGANAIALTGDPSSWPGVYQTVSITGGNEYRFTSWLSVQGLTIGSYYFQVSWQDDNGNEVGAADSFAWVTTNGTFEKYESVFTAPSTATQVFFKVQANNANGIGYIDSLSIVDTAGDTVPQPGTNLLTNPGFETGNKSGWEGPGTVQSAIVHAGANAIALTGVPSSWPGVHQTVSITGGNSYRFTAWLSVLDLTAGSYYFQVSWEDNNGNQVGATDSFAWVTANGTFEKYEAVFAAPSAATQVFFKVQANNANGTGYIDSLSIVDTAGDN